MKKIVIYVVMLVFLAGGVGFGTYALLSDNSYKNNNVSFTLKDNEAYFTANGHCYIGQSNIDTHTPSNTFYARFWEEEYFAGITGTYGNWHIGTIEFVNNAENEADNVTVFAIELTIENKNKDPNKSLEVAFKNIAFYDYDETDPDAKPLFVTGINLGENVEYNQRNYCNSEDPLLHKESDQVYEIPADENDDTSRPTLGVLPQKIGYGQSATFVFSFHLNTQTQRFGEFVNNITVELGSVANS